MKKFPYPDHTLKTKEEVREHVEQLIFNVSAWLKIDGYSFHVLFPGEENFEERDNAGASVCVKHPYKRFFVSIQQDSIDKMLRFKKDSPLWKNIEESMFHEMLHVLVWDFSEIAGRRFTTAKQMEDLEETFVDHLAALIHKLVDDRRPQNKK